MDAIRETLELLKVWPESVAHASACTHFVLKESPGSLTGTSEEEGSASDTGTDCGGMLCGRIT